MCILRILRYAKSEGALKENKSQNIIILLQMYLNLSDNRKQSLNIYLDFIFKLAKSNVIHNEFLF